MGKIRLIQIDEETWRTIRSLAALKGLTVREMVYMALQDYIKKDPKGPRLLELVQKVLESDLKE